LTGTVNIDPEAGAWIINQNRLEITLEKQFPLEDWPLLLAGPLQIPDRIIMCRRNIYQKNSPLVMENTSKRNVM